MYEEIMTNDDNLEANLLASSLLKMLVQVLLQAEPEIPSDKLVLSILILSDCTPGELLLFIQIVSG